MQAFLISALSIGVGGALAGVTAIGLVNAQTAPPDQTSDSSVTVDYGSGN